MARIIEARVIQKIDTEQNWNANELILYKGEIALVGDPDRVYNIKVGNGVKKFRDLPYMVNYVNGLYTGIITPQSQVPSGVNNVFLVTQPGTYTNFGGVVLPKDNLGVIYKNGNNYTIQLIPIVSEEKLQKYIDEKLVDINVDFGGEITSLNQSPNVQGMYIPKVSGVYPNFGNLEYDPIEGFTMFLYKDGQFSKIVVPLNAVEGDVNFNNNTLGVSGSAVEKYAVKKVNTISELRDTKGEYEGQVITLLGYYATNDKPPLNYKWTSADTLDDGGYSIQTIKGGTWLADLDYIIDIRHFGAKCDLINSDSTFIEKCQNYIFINRPLINISAGNEKGGGVIYFPKSLLITQTIVLKKGVSLQGNSKIGTNIHCYEQMIGITNFDGYDENGFIKTTNNFSLKDFVISQGSILISATYNCLFENLRVMNIVGRDAFIFDGLFVDCKIKNVHIISCDRTGFIAKDYLGTGPSTTMYVDGLYVQRCLIGIVIDGNSTSNHYILTSTFKNIISEYNTTGIILQGNIENVTFDGVHLEQNENPLGIYDNVSVNLKNIWNDLGDIIIYNNNNQQDCNITLEDVKSRVIIQGGYKGQIYIKDNVSEVLYPPTSLVHNVKGNTCTTEDRTTRANIGYTTFDKSIGKSIVWNGNNWVDSQGNIV